ncbi:MAG: hypothetical protein D6718_07215 [Acidobacteria bacterium]|nr:MAG: hypothetical protein D6718_07215 [Acidobacteriota bacterium]
MKRRALLAAAAFVSLSVLVPPAHAGNHSAASKIDPELQRVLESAAPGELIPVYFVLADQLTGPALRAHAAGVRDRAERRRRIVGALKAHAERTQARLRGELRALAAAGAARRVRFLWIGNVVAADLTAADIRRLAELPEVARVRHSPKRPVFLGEPACLELPAAQASLAPGQATEIECGVSLMRAPDVWNDLGITGEGAVVAMIDSGVCWSHPDIVNQIWVNPGEDLDGDGVVMDPDDLNGVDDDGNGYVDDLIGYDIDNRDHDPDDGDGHGSHTAGTVAGDGTSGTQAGMAPDARLMVLRVGLTTSDEPDVWEAMQYAADNGADLISMSLGWKHSWNPDRATWRTNCENTIDAGTAMVIAAGNEGAGNEPDNVRTPGDVPRVITVGAVDCNDAIASFSSRGPVTWQDVPPWNDWPYPPGLTKPDVSGPGVNTKSHYFCSGYTYKSGTSMATPHVAGAAALMISNNPGLTHDDIKQILEDTAVDLGDPGKDNVYGSGRADAYEAVLASATSDGIVRIKESVATCSDLLHITVSDADLKGTGTVDVEVFSGAEPSPEIVTLTESSAGSGVFRGEIETDPGPPAPDGKIQVVHADTVTARYIDADDGKGGTDVPKTDTATTDCRSPAISDVHTTDVTDTSAVVRWTTDESSDSVVDYGEGIPPDQQASDPSLVTAHAVTLSGLSECTVYYYSVSSADRFGQSATDDNAGQYYRFETYGNFPDIGLAPCHEGRVTLDKDPVSCSDTLGVSVNDLDLNRDSSAVETVVVHVFSSTEPDGEAITLTEESANSARFSGTVDLAPGPAIPGDGLLQVADGDLITASYFDEDDGTGSSRWASDTSKADCRGPEIRDVRVSWIGRTSATLTWTTSEPATTHVDYGPTPALGAAYDDQTLATQHEARLSGFDECGRIYFTVSGTDAYGNSSSADAGGEPFAFNTDLIPGLYYFDDFEGPGNWTLGSEWEIGTPQGKGGSSGPPDPDGAFAGSGALGFDLSGQGSWPGDYEPGIQTSTASPHIACSNCTNTVLMFRRHLAVHSGDEAAVELVGTGDSMLVWQNNGATVTDSSWTLQKYDVSGFADGMPVLQIVFRHRTNSSIQYSGWNVDEIALKDGSLPDFAACGGCGGAPSFAGVKSVRDPDACAPGGLEVSWDEAAAWGTGSAGTYAIYRSTDPQFVPDATTLVASGVTGTTWTDASAPEGTTVHYIVRAENDETCGSGPANGGLVDGNLVRRSGVETSSRPPADSPGDSLRAGRWGHAHVRLTWNAASGASFYRVLRGARPDLSDGIVIGEPAEPRFDDEGALTDARAYFYRVVSVNPCGAETP